MASVCMSNCVNDARDPRVSARATYVNLYKWPESDAEFVRSSVSPNRPRLMDRISWRQAYLRSYTFTREEEETAYEMTPGCLGRSATKGKVPADHVKKKKKKRNKRKRGVRGRKRKSLVFRIAFSRFFQKLLSCSASVDVVNPIV